MDQNTQSEIIYTISKGYAVIGGIVTVVDKELATKSVTMIKEMLLVRAKEIYDGLENNDRLATESTLMTVVQTVLHHEITELHESEENNRKAYLKAVTQIRKNKIL